MSVKQFDKAETNETELSVYQFGGARTKQMSLSVSQFDKVEQQLVHWSIVRYDGMSEEKNALGVTKDSNMTGDISTEKSKSLDNKNEERGGEQTDCMSGAGRVSDISDTPATQYLYYRWNDFEEAQYGDEARGAT